MDYRRSCGVSVIPAADGCRSVGARLISRVGGAWTIAAVVELIKLRWKPGPPGGTSQESGKWNSPHPLPPDTAVAEAERGGRFEVFYPCDYYNLL